MQVYSQTTSPLSVSKKIKLTAHVFFLMFTISGCHWISPKPSPPPPIVCKPLVCPAPTVVEKIIRIPILPKTAGVLNLPIIGEIEKVHVSPGDIWYNARIDTGASLSSIHAENIRLIERDGEKRVTFSLRHPTTKSLIQLERKYQRKVFIKQKLGKPEKRYVVKLWLSLGDTKELVDVTLIDRSAFNYPLLVGRNLLIDIAIVDVSRKHTIR